MPLYSFLNNEFLPGEKAVLHVRDLSIQRGYGVFDFLKIIKGKPIFLEEHLDRFYFSANQMHLVLKLSKDKLREVIVTLIHKNETVNGGLRLTLTGGYSPDGYTLSQPNLIITQHSFSFPSKEQFHKGLSLVSYEYQRQLPEVKTIDYLMAIWLQPWIQKHNADDVVYHTGGWITECPRSNIFLVSEKNKLLTPSANILKGITRMKVLEAAKSLFEVEERPIHLEELARAKEAFITSSTKMILPVNRIDERIFTTPGEATLRLYEVFSSLQEAVLPLVGE